MQTLLLTLIFIGIYTVIKIAIVEYMHDKNMHEQCACTKTRASYKKVVGIGTISVDSAPRAVLQRSAPMVIAVHRRGAVSYKKPDVFMTETRSLRPDSIYAYPTFRNNPFAPTLQNPKTTSNTPFCVQKNIYVLT